MGKSKSNKGLQYQKSFLYLTEVIYLSSRYLEVGLIASIASAWLLSERDNMNLSLS